MMDRVAGAQLLARWNLLMHEHGAELEELRSAGVSERRIEVLYPSRGVKDYTAKLSHLLADRRSFAILHRRFKPDRALLQSSTTGWSAVREEAGVETRSRSYSLGTSDTGEVVDSLHRLYPRTFKKWSPAAHEFAAAMLILPTLLREVQEYEVSRLYRYALGANREASAITFEQLTADVNLLLGLSDSQAPLQQRRYPFHLR